MIMLYKNLARAYSDVLTIDTTGFNEKFGLRTFTVPYNFSGELPDGIRSATVLLLKYLFKYFLT